MGGGPVDLRQVEVELERAKASVTNGQPIPAELQQLLDMFETIKQSGRMPPKWRSVSSKKNRHGKPARKPVQVCHASVPETLSEPELGSSSRRP